MNRGLRILLRILLIYEFFQVCLCVRHIRCEVGALRHRFIFAASFDYVRMYTELINVIVRTDLVVFLLLLLSNQLSCGL